MADKNQLKIANQVDLADDDPFAELTRIMGFDPRQPARRPEPAPIQPLAQAAQQPVPVEQVIEEDDFSLDLEKELLGGFDLEEEPLSGLEASFSAEPVQDFSPGDVSESDFAEVDFDFGDAFEPAAANPEAPRAADLAEPEFGFDDDLEAAFAAAVHEDEVAKAEEARIEDDLEFDLGLTNEDVRALDDSRGAPVVHAPLPVTPEAVVSDIDFEADFGAAIADIDMGLLNEASGPEATTPAEKPVAEPTDFDPNIFDDADFQLADEFAVAEEPAGQGTPETRHEEVLPEIDAGAFAFGLDDLRLDDGYPAEDEHPAEMAVAAAPPTDEISFEDVDFGGDLDLVDSRLVAPETPVEELFTVAESSPPLGRPEEPVTASNFELAVPAYVPRKLPTSPMDVAAEEFRQREATAVPVGPEFNLEDELNALLGNIRPTQDRAEMPTAQSAPVLDAPANFAPSPPLQEYETAVPGIFGTSGETAYRPPVYRDPEPVAFEAPEHPADIDDNLTWELDSAFATEAEPADQDDIYAEEDRSLAYRDDPFARSSDEGSSYAEGYGIGEEDLGPVDLDMVFSELAENPVPPQPAVSYGDAFAGAALGTATARFDSSFKARPFDTTPVGRIPERLGNRQEPAASEPDRFSPHRDPVVRGNPMAEDPLDIITQLAEKYSRKETPASHDQFPEDEVDGDIDISDLFEEQPDVETVEVDDQAIALADDLDIPELPDDEELPQLAAYDDLDAEFSSLLSDINSEPSAQGAAGYQDPLSGGFSTRPYETPMAAASAGNRLAPVRQSYDDLGPDSFALDAGGLSGDGHDGQFTSGSQYSPDDYDYDPDFEQEIAPQHFAAEQRRKPGSRGLLVAGLVGGVALVGAIGAFAFSFGGDAGGNTPTIVKADEGPVKVRPENPGGATVPNQENKVYETVAGETGNAAAQQEKLVTTAEEPMDVAPPALEEDDPISASGKSEDRIEQIVQDAENETDAEIAAVAPRKVRTMVVKPDGTLVPREDEPEAAPSGEQTDTIAAVAPSSAPAAIVPESAAPEPTTPGSATPESATLESTGALPETSAPALAPVPEETQASATPVPGEMTGIPDAEDTASMPDTVPIAPLRPADQPLDVVGEVAPNQVAAATTAAAAGGSWAMQIASQPSEAAAQSSYQDLVRRYGNVLQGRDVNIVKAEIAGKGTFWRVRVPANSRNEAISLCETYKAAGGNCFVSR